MTEEIEAQMKRKVKRMQTTQTLNTVSRLRQAITTLLTDTIPGLEIIVADYGTIAPLLEQYGDEILMDSSHEGLPLDDINAFFALLIPLAGQLSTNEAKSLMSRLRE